MRAGTRRFPAAPRPAWGIADKVVISGVSCLGGGWWTVTEVLTGGKRSNYFPARATGGVSPVAVLLSVPGRCGRPGQNVVCCGLALSVLPTAHGLLSLPPLACRPPPAFHLSRTLGSRPFPLGAVITDLCYCGPWDAARGAVGLGLGADFCAPGFKGRLSVLLSPP